MLTREKVFSCEDRVIEKLDVPEWNDFLYVRSLSAGERDEYENANLIRKHGTGKRRTELSFDVRIQNAKTHLVVLASCDEQFNRIFADSDIDSLAKKNSAAVDRIFEVAARLSKITKEDLEETVKN